MSSWEKLVHINRYWRDGLRRVAEQRARIEDIDHGGGDATRSRELLAILEEAVVAAGTARTRLLEEVRLATPETKGEPGRPSRSRLHQQ